MRFYVLDSIVDIYKSGKRLFVINRLNDIVTETTGYSISALLSEIDKQVPQDMVLWLRTASQDQVIMAVCSNAEITDWKKIPRDAREKKPVKPSEFLGE